MTTITPMPPAPNPLTDSQSAYNSKALAFAQALPPLVTEINTVSGEMNAAASNAAASASTATTQAGIATAQVAAAEGFADSASDSAAAASAYIASLPDGSINDAMVGSATAYSSARMMQVVESDAVTMVNKTLEATTLTNGYTEEVFALSGTAPVISAANGSIQTWVLTGTSAPSLSLASGQSVTLMIQPSSYTITWTGINWLRPGGSGSAPTLYTVGRTLITLWKIGALTFGAHAGDA